MSAEKQVPGLDCPLDHEYSEEEWRAFVHCAREGMESGERLHNDYQIEIEGHGLSGRETEQAVRLGARLVRYVNREGRAALGLWDPQSRLFVVGTVPDGLVLTAFLCEDERRFRRYVGRFEGLRWLR